MAEPTRAQKIAGRKANAVKTLAGLKLTTLKLTGDKKLLKTLNGVRDSVARGAMKTAITKAARILAKEMKNAVPVQFKAAKVLFGSRMQRAKGGMFAAKAGAGVGNTAKKEAKRGKGKRKGVGMTGANIHWMVLGTKSRTVNKTKMYRGGKLVEVTNWPTGEMWPILGRVVRRGFTAGQSKAAEVIRNEIRAKLAKAVKSRGH